MRMIQSMRRATERGFTVVEVIIGVCIVSAVVAGGVYFAAGAGKSQQNTLVRQRMASAADAIMQRVRADRSWLETRPKCKTSECSVTDLFPIQKPGPGDPTLLATVKIVPVDSNGDKQGDLDEDRLVPDFYRIVVTINLSTEASEKAKWGTQPPFETVSTVDATALGRATGSLIIQTGTTTNQVDERMAFSSVRAKPTRLAMNEQPMPCTNPFPISFNEWATRRPMLPLGCNDALKSAENTNPFLSSVNIVGVQDVSFSIERIAKPGEPTTKRTSGDADEVTSDGEYAFSGLPAGGYRIVANPGKGRELWRTKMIPSDGKTSVQANQEARALIMVRPKQGTGKYTVRATRQVYLYHLGTSTKSISDTWKQYGATFRTTTTYVYLTGEGPKKETWGGPAWNSIVSMEPKPFDRYRYDQGSASYGQAAQQTLMLGWNGKNTNGNYTFQGLPTGLQSSPERQETPQPVPDDLWGELGKRTQTCFKARTPGGTCGNFAWIDHRPGSLGQPNSRINWHSNDGECYLESSVSGYKFGRKLQNGSGHKNRCSRDFIYMNPETGKRTVVADFLPDKSGKGGGRMVLSIRNRTECIADCGLIPPPPSESYFGTQDPSSGGDNPTAGHKDGPPPTTSVKNNSMKIVKSNPLTGLTTTLKTNAPAMLPSN